MCVYFFYFTIERDNIPVTTIDAAYIASEGVGYIKVNRFGRTTMQEFREAMAKLSGVDALILDLAGNGGGLLNQAGDLAGYFLPQDCVITSVEGRVMDTELLRAKKGGEFDGRLVVIIDENSASGSELVAGALQDWDRAVIVGRDSYGKGLVQREMPMGDGSAVRLTVARYHTPSGRVIQRPYERGKADEYHKAYIERLRSVGEDSVVLKSKFKTLRLGRDVYADGGIRPDIVVQSDTTQISDYMVKVVAKGVYNELLLGYLDHNREKLQNDYPTFERFEKEYNFPDEQMQRLVELATAKGVEYNAEGYELSRELMRTQLTAMVAQRLFSTSEYYRYINPRVNDSYKRVLLLLEEKFVLDELLKKNSL